jgi:cytidyltransferase-like protein
MGKILLEGGNIFKDANKTPLTQRINRADVDPTIRWLEVLLDISLIDHKLGTTGKKPTSGDLDLAVDETQVSKEDLMNVLKAWVKQNHPKDRMRSWVAKSGISLHFKTPINGDDSQGYVQTDLMFGDPQYMAWSSQGEPGEQYRGQHRMILLNSIASAKGYKWSGFNGLTNRKTMEKTTDIQQITDILLGPDGSPDDLTTIPRILAAISGDENYDQLVAMAIETFPKFGVKFPERTSSLSESILLEGGLAGHMSHLHENPNLTFHEIKEIFKKAANGQLEGTEKTDGQNIFISYNVNDGTARAGRNKTNIKNGGMTSDELAAKFAGRGEVEWAFRDAFGAFERAVAKFTPDEQIAIFGDDTNIYYNAEIQDPRNANTINYDRKTLTIHRVGHGEFNRTTGVKTERDVTRQAFMLGKTLERTQEQIQDEEFRIEINAIRKLQQLSEQKPLNDALEQLESIMDLEGISDNHSVGDYLVSRLAKTVDYWVPGIPAGTKQVILKRLLGEKGTNIRHILASVPEDMKDDIREMLGDSKSIIKDAVSPLEGIIHTFSVEMLSNLESAFILDNEKEVNRLQAMIRKAIKLIKKSKREDAMEILQTQLTKLKSVEKISSAVEGFVFDYNGSTYKFTGNFTPINNILGMFTYGTKDFTPLDFDSDDDTIAESESDGSKGSPVVRRLAIVPGAFKPPHKGHLAMVMHYAELVDKVIVMVSPLSRQTPSGKDIGFGASEAIWGLYLDAYGLREKVQVVRSPVNSPVRAAFDFVANEDSNPLFAQAGDLIILGTSTKGGDQSRFNQNLQQYAGAGVTIANALEYAYTPQEEHALSASDFRKILETGGSEELERFIPKKVDHQQVYDILQRAAGLEEKKKPYMEPHMHQDQEMVDETSTVAAVGGFAGSVKPKYNRKEIVESVFNYLLGKEVL